MTSYRNGLTSGIGGGNPSPKKRSTIKGWSAAAVRRHTAWLYSVDAGRLDGVGVAYTLTMRDTPPSADEFHALRRAFIMRLERHGATRIHWVVEWQRRGTPHLHMAVYYPESSTVSLEDYAARAIFAWTAMAEEYVARREAQWFSPVHAAEGWLKYLSKHASRGVRHYQRWGHPEGWDRTGRLWGHTGEWPTDAPMVFDMDPAAYARFRRLVRSWRVADARASGDPQRIRYARRMLKCNDRRLSTVRGVSDWIPDEVAAQLIYTLWRDGHSVALRDDPQPSGAGQGAA